MPVIETIRIPVTVQDAPDMPVDADGTSATLAKDAHIHTLKICLMAAVVLVACLGAALFFASARKPYVSIIRTDQVRGAELISVPGQAAIGLKSSDARAFLWDWCLLRYRILKGDARENLERSLIAMSSNLAAKYRASDTKRIAEVIAGKLPEQTAEYRFISITPLRRDEYKGRVVLVGHALIKLVVRHNLQATSEEDDTKQAFRIDLDFYMDPEYAAKRGESDIEYQIYNPLGIVITDLWDTLIPMGDGA